MRRVFVMAGRYGEEVFEFRYEVQGPDALETAIEEALALFARLGLELEDVYLSSTPPESPVLH